MPDTLEHDKEELHTVLEDLTEFAKEVFETEYKKEEKGSQWKYCEPRWHYFKAIDELCKANAKYQNDGHMYYEISIYHANALNHMLFALWIHMAENPDFTTSRQ